MKSLAFFSALTALGVSLAVYACATTDSGLGTFGSGSGGSENSSTSSGSTTGTTSSSSGSTNGKGGTGIDLGTGTVNPDAACGSGDQPAQLTPVYMVFIYDKSGSMGDDPVTPAELADTDPANDVPAWENKATRWDPMKLGMSDFFKNSGTIGVEASLELFPAPGDKVQTCHADYKTPAVKMTSLETPGASDALIKALDLAVIAGGTPTLPAVMGGIAYAKQLMTTNPGSKAVVVLVTDGEPGIYNATLGVFEHDCSPVGFAPANNPDPLTYNDIPTICDVVSAAYRAVPPIPTYVIGIGEAQGEMSAIATAGGTKYIQLDATKPPAETSATLTAELKAIRTTQFECSMPIPKSVDFKKDLVNVSFKHTSGTIDQLGKSAGCAAPGWYFDNEATPTKIMLCPATCSSIQLDLTGKLQILLGCPTIIL